MTITLYTCTDPKNKVSKSTTLVQSLTGTLKGNTDILNPVVDIEYSAFDFNYVYISEFGRYYFVTSLKSMSNSLIRMELHVDVLMSYATAITGMSALVGRNENSYHSLLPDSMIPIEEGYETDFVEFPTQPFTVEDDPSNPNAGYHYVLGCLGVPPVI